jgi:hypothetical protein
LAADFLGIEVDGSHYDKAWEIKAFQSEAATFSSMKMKDMKIRFTGDIAIAQGHLSFKKKNGDGSGGIAFTDTWVLIGGRWQVIAAEDLEVPPEP